MKRSALLFYISLAAISASCLSPHAEAASKRPNVILIITDDQGYGDLGSTGNPIIKTPQMDKLAAESVTLDDFHVAPTCAPTRAALLTGHWSNRTGVWHTVMGRSMLRDDEVTLGQLLKDNGYTTGMFGKWHLGDNFPYRPEDRGFDEVLRHGGGGVGQTPDAWDNAYFDGQYFHNGKRVAAKGFCTDVFFDAGHDFIRKSAQQKKPFFAYIAPNAPHIPLHCPQEYMDLYADQSPDIAAFYGMITNIDDNLGKTRALLEELGIAENTILIFTTDNGTATGRKIFNAGMRDGKGSKYDGGHRVPFFIHWPKGGMERNYPVEVITHAVDVVPTLLDLTSSSAPGDLKFDGLSLAPLLDPTMDVDWADRMLITDSQRVVDPIKWRNSAVMSNRWRLIDGIELYDIKADPGQRKDIAAEHTEQVAVMREFYEKWWAELEPGFAETTEIYLGHPAAPKVTLTAHDWIGHKPIPWAQSQVRSALGLKRDQMDTLKHEGNWAVKVVTPGTYEISLLRWPEEANRPIRADMPPGEPVPGASRGYRTKPGFAIPAREAVLRINGVDIESKPVGAEDVKVSFTTELGAGSHQLAPVFILEQGGEVGAYYAVIHQRPNILFIMSDDHTTQAVGAYATLLKELNPTPTIDTLAAEGMTFDNAFATNSICTPSRAAILTGQYPHTNGVFDLNGRLDPERQTLPILMRQAGYQTAMIGKWHLKAEPNFDYYKVLPGQGAYMNPKFRVQGEQPWPKNLVQHEGQHSTDAITDSTLDWFKNQRDPNKPFFVCHQYKAPHDYFVNAPRYQDYLKDVTIPEPPTLYDVPDSFGSLATRGYEDELRPHIGTSIGKRNPRRSYAKDLFKRFPDEFPAHYDPDTMSLEETTRYAYQAYLKKYLRCVKGVDDNLQRLFDYLKAEGLYENTLIIYTGDQGFWLGENDYQDKRWAYDPSMRMPFIVRYPKSIPAATRSDAIVENVDYPALMLDFAGIERPACMQGRSFKSICETGQEPTDWKQAAYYRYWMHMAHHDNPGQMAIRTKTHKLIYLYGCDYQGENQTPPAWELYDLTKDPSELNNVYDDPAYADLRDQLKQELAQLRQDIGDDGSHYPAAEAIVQAFWDYDAADRARAIQISQQFKAQREAKLNKKR